MKRLLKHLIVSSLLILLLLNTITSVFGTNDATPSIRKGLGIGRTFGAVIKDDASLWLWGDNYFGQVGNGNQQNQEYPVHVLDDVVYVSCGWYHTAAIKSNGELWMWGSNTYHAIDKSNEQYYLSPKKIMDHVKSVSLGWDNTAVIQENGNLLVWGNNTYGALGVVSDGNDVNIPTKILSDVISCSISIYNGGAVTSDGSLWMWGRNNNGVVGDGTLNDVDSPKRIADGFKDVSVDWWYAAALDQNNSLWTWGKNWYGNLGDGTYIDKNTPEKVLDNVESFDTGYLSMSAISLTGELYTWGNCNRRLQDGSQSNSSTPEVITSGISEACQTEALSACVDNTGQLWLWGIPTNNCYGSYEWTDNPIHAKSVINDAVVVHPHDNSVQKYKLYWHIYNETIVQEYSAGDTIIEPDIPQKDGLQFLFWRPNVPDSMPKYDIDITAVFEEVENPHQHSFSDNWKHDSSYHWKECACGEKANVSPHSYKDWIVVEPATATREGQKKHICSICNYEEYDTIPSSGDISPLKSAVINTKNGTVNYKSTVTIIATANNVPTGYYLAIYDEDGIQLAKGDNQSVSTELKKMTQTRTLIASIVDDEGIVQRGSNYQVLSKEVTITVKSGFIDRVVAFFLRFFGIRKNVTIKP